MRLPLICLILPVTACLSALAQSPAPVAWYKLDAAASFGQDASGHSLLARAVNGQHATGVHGGGMALTGDGGLEIPGVPAVATSRGFTFEMWVRFDTVSENMGLVSKTGEYLLRIDPPAEGGKISFFVNPGGSLEPRVFGLAPKPGIWYHIVATWDTDQARLWINGQLFSGTRRGAIEQSDAPVLVGLPSHYGPIGIKGIIDDVRLYDRALTEQEVLLAEYGLDQLPAGPKAADARFEFDNGMQGWAARDADDVRVAGGRLHATTRAGTALLLNPNLDVPVAGKSYVALRMAVTAGKEGRLLLYTTGGLTLSTLPLIADGAMHSYVVHAADLENWSGRLLAVGLLPSDEACSADIDFLRVAAEAEAPPEIAVTNFYTDDALNRAGRPCRILATIRNTGGPGKDLAVKLSVPPGVKAPGAEKKIDHIAWNEERELTWDIVAPQALTGGLQLIVSGAGMATSRAKVQIAFMPPVNLPKADYVPEPQIPQSDYLVGCHYCPLWKQGSRAPGGWQEITPFPERKPALGWYDEGDPEVTDWDIKWALEHGIQYFVYCWYRASQGGPVKQNLGHAIHEGLFHARYGDKFKFAIMWENQSRGSAGVASEDDFLNNLLPFFIDQYFKRPNYLKVDGKPLLFIYRPEFLVDDLGGVDKVKSALDKAREACRKAGLGGLTILGEYRGTDPAPLKLMLAEGLDYSFAYCWPVGGQPTPDVAVDTQESIWKEWQRLNILPGLLTASMGWDPRPWYTTDQYWRLPPADFKRVLERAKTSMDALPAEQLGHKLLLLDNWNEFGEGHYIAPHRQYGFGYLDAVRDVFTRSPGAHQDLVPEDIGRGPYDKLFRAYLDRMTLTHKVVTAPGGVPAGLIGWWTFDEPDGQEVANDWSGHGLGGFVSHAERVAGPHGRALECSGGCVTVPEAGKSFGLGQLSVSCWLRTDVGEQEDKWFVNNIYDGGGAGFRFGLSGGNLSFAIPKTPWSHHLVASEPLPLGKWVFVAGTFDGKVMRVYQDGKEVGTLERPGRVYGNNWALCLGNFDLGHNAYFHGLLADVKIWSRALTAEEVAGMAK